MEGRHLTRPPENVSNGVTIHVADQDLGQGLVMIQAGDDQVGDLYPGAVVIVATPPLKLQSATLPQDHAPDDQDHGKDHVKIKATVTPIAGQDPGPKVIKDHFPR